jgi:hypothetical protein
MNQNLNTVYNTPAIWRGFVERETLRIYQGVCERGLGKYWQEVYPDLSEAGSWVLETVTILFDQLRYRQPILPPPGRFHHLFNQVRELLAYLPGGLSLNTFLAGWDPTWTQKDEAARTYVRHFKEVHMVHQTLQTEADWTALQRRLGGDPAEVAALYQAQKGQISGTPGQTARDMAKVITYSSTNSQSRGIGSQTT